MTSNQLPPPEWVNDKDSLERMVEDLSVQAQIAVDTESNSLHAYREQVCLIQFSTPKTDYILDPLVFDDLSSLAPIFSNPEIEKIFHAAEYDLICLKRDFGFEFHNLFDTMQAARILGSQHVGLERLLLEKFEVSMDKRYQKADWGKRPLTPAQLDYARMDTRYLSALRDLLEHDLREMGRWGFAEDDFLLACEVDVPKEKMNGSTWKRFGSRKGVTLRELTILRELCLSRDEIAERMDRPPFKVITDADLFEIARNAPEKDVDLAGLGLSQRQINLWGGMILEAVKHGVDAPLVQWEQAKRPSDAMLKRLDKLKAWRKQEAAGMEVDSDIVLPKKFVSLFSEKPPKNMQMLQSAMKASPYRFEKYGEQIYSLIGG